MNEEGGGRRRRKERERGGSGVRSEVKMIGSVFCAYFSDVCQRLETNIPNTQCTDINCGCKRGIGSGDRKMTKLPR